MVGITDRANREVVRCFNATPGSRLSRVEVARAGGGHHNHRLLLEAALGADLLDEVPERSTVQAAREYPYWFDATYGRYFLGANAGKAFETVPPAHGAGPGDPGAYRLRDVLVDREAGYVILSRATGSPASAGLRLFVRHPGITRDGSGATFRITDKAADAASPVSIAGRDLPVVRSGRGWALVSLESAGRSVPPDSLRVEFDPNRSVSLARGRPAEDVRSGEKLRR